MERHVRLVCLCAELEGLPHELLVEALKLLEAQGKAQCARPLFCSEHMAHGSSHICMAYNPQDR